MHLKSESPSVFDPISTKNAIAKKYLSYLSSVFALTDQNLKVLFENELNIKHFLNGPFLEITPPYRKGTSISELISEKILSEEFFKLEPDIPDNDRDLPLNRPLYIHQEQSIRRAVKGENLIISTGTGSGKTESFLIPIINHLMRIKEQKGEISPGVRAIFLYPMNALVNDQIKRLRNLLKYYPDITFGRYTGETRRNNPNKQRLNDDGTPALPNELIFRVEMWETPPHLLFTNYSMLEFLLLRPDDSPLFETDNESKWNYIVLDEIHTYTGAKGIEIGMLLRRLQQRVLGADPHIQCIGTSATLVGENKQFEAVTSFAHNIFNQDFLSDSVIQSEIDDYQVKNPWRCSNNQLFTNISKIFHCNKSDIEKIEETIQIAKDCGVPEKIYQHNKLKKQSDFPRFLYHLFKDNQEIADIREILRSEGTMDLEKVAKIIFSDTPDATSLMCSIIECASHAKPGKNDHHLLPAKYHLFIRAPEGAYIYYDPNPRILLDPHEWYSYNGNRFRVYELAACKECGVAYITAKMIGSKKKILKPYNSAYGNVADLFLTETPLETKNTIEFQLCTKCGQISERKNNSRKTVECDCEDLFLKNIYLVKPTNGGDGIVHTCPHCLRTHTTNPIIEGFHVPNDKISAVVALEFFQKLPVCHNKKRKLISFADSRQDAAFFPVFLNREYESIQIRSFAVHLIAEKADKVLANTWTLSDLADQIKLKIQGLNTPETGGILSNRKIKTSQDIENIVQKYAIEDFIQYAYERGPEALGLASFEPIKPQIIEHTFLHESPWNLTDDEVWDLSCMLFDIFRQFRAVPDDFPLIHPFAGVPGFKGAYRLNTPSKNSNMVIKSWVSKPPSINKPFDTLQKVWQKIGAGNRNIRDDLEQIWDQIFINGQFHDFFLARLYNGPVYVLNTDKWKLTSIITHPEKQWFFCPVCNRMTSRNVKGVCPTYRCGGSLFPCVPEKIFENSYYWSIFLGNDPSIRMRACEHTAQLSPERASKVQKAFTEGKVDLLSCSTTFELGVDLGELQGVFLKNVPPTPANYIQRVGRAGRRTPPAYAVTTCHRSPHDMAHYHEPKRMIQGKIHPPLFTMENEKIVRRHLISVALSLFFQKKKSEENIEFKKIDSFFSLGGGVEAFEEYLIEKDESLLENLCRITPSLLHTLLEINDNEWTFFQDLFGDEGIIRSAVEEYRSYILLLEEIRDNFVRLKKFAIAGYIDKIIRSEKDQNGIAYLSNHNIIPKYGFPVDVVELKAYRDPGNLRLQRDLRIALSEYAPGSQIIANGKMWTSRYLVMIPKYDLPEYNYIICPKCKTVYTWRFGEPDLIQCSSCSEPLGKPNRYLTPKFGFIDNQPPEDVPRIRPERSYASRVYYIGKEPQNPKKRVVRSKNGKIIVNVKAATNGRLLVLNDSREQGFWICKQCGYGARVDAIDAQLSFKTMEHNTSTESNCNGVLHKYSLGHDFQTDVLIFEFSGIYDAQEGFWESLLYSFIEGICYSRDIDRRDIDGCLYLSGAGQQIIIFDDVPGGAGLVRQCIQSDDTLMQVFKGAGLRLKNCNCGGEEASSSCYGCLKQYKNQFCHEILNRRYAMDFFDQFW